MRKKNPSTLTALVAFIAIVNSSITMAELRPEEIQELRRLSEITQITIDGNAFPELVPDSVRMRIFFYRYANRGYAPALADKLTEQDASILAAYSATHAATVQREDAAVTRTYEDIMSHAEALNGVELAVALENASQQSQLKARKRYDELLGKLSPQGERAVRNFAYERVRVSMSLDNPVGVAAKAPELFKKSTMEGYAAERESRVAMKKSARPSPVQAQSVETQSSPSSIRFSH